MLTLLENREHYDPSHLDIRDVLVGGTKILDITPKLRFSDAILVSDEIKHCEALRQLIDADAPPKPDLVQFKWLMADA